MPPAKRARRPSPARLRKLLAHEHTHWDRGLTYLAGVDEVGRGPLAGPVVAAAVILPQGCWIPGVTDSKKLSGAQRRELIERISGSCVAFGIGAASAREIDRVNIRGATALAMRRAIQRLPVPADHLLVDGLPVPELGRDSHTAIVQGDACVHCIAAASILAKVTRDRLMERLARRYPGYGWERNMGYGTSEHLDALARLGPTPHHRISFAPVRLSIVPQLP
jgi:ribonuclease HII